MKKNIYYFRESESYEKDGYGYAESSDAVDSVWIYQGTPLKEDEEDKTWETPVFMMEYGKFADYLDNDCGWCLCSEKLKNILEPYIDNAFKVLWLPVNVRGDETMITYYALLIETPLFQKEVVDYEKSKKLKDGEVYLPHFVYSKIKNFSLFVVDEYPSYVFVSNEIKQILENEKITGIGFQNRKAS